MRKAEVFWTGVGSLRSSFGRKEASLSTLSATKGEKRRHSSNTYRENLRASISFIADWTHITRGCRNRIKPASGKKAKLLWRPPVGAAVAPAACERKLADVPLGGPFSQKESPSERWYHHHNVALMNVQNPIHY